jgi:FtsH-binding integral membrane protein
VKPTRYPVLAVALIVAAALSWAVVRFLYTSLPLLPWTMVPSLLLLALGELYTALVTRARIQRRPGTKPVEPLVAARLAALAKASAHAAAALAGVFGGMMIYLASSLDKPTPRRDFWVSGGTTLAAITLIVAALVLEHACRVPKGPEDEDQHHSASRI